MIHIDDPTPNENILLLEIQILTYEVEKTELIGKIILQKRTNKDYINMALRLEWVKIQIQSLRTESLKQRNDIYNLQKRLN